MNQKMIDDTLASLLIEAVGAATWYWNVSTNEVKINQRWAEFLGYTLEELDPMTFDKWKSCVHPDDLSKALLELSDIQNTKKEAFNFEIRLRHKNGHYLWVSDRGKIVSYDYFGNPSLVIGLFFDIDEKRRITEDLRKSELNLRQILENTKDIIYRIDLEGRFTFLSKSWEEHLGHPINEVLNKSFEPYIHPDDLNKVIDFFERIQKYSNYQEIKGYRVRDKNGVYKYFETNGQPIIENNQTIGYSGIAKDISELLDKERKIEYLIYHDNLTDFKNRHFFDQKIHEINRIENYPLCIISCDLNDLKNVNDTLGHHKGDQMIVKAAEIIRRHMPNKEYLIRTGGDEFLIFLPNTEEETAYNIRESIKKDIETVSTNEFPLSIAYGYYVKKTYTEDIREDIKMSDKLMYQNKNKYKTIKSS